MTLCLAHLVSLREIGGISRDYVDFVAATRRLGLARNHTLLTQPGVAGPLVGLLESGSDTIGAADRLGPIRLPRWLRRSYLRWRLGRLRADALVLWSTPAAAALSPPQVSGIYYEHGAAWFEDSLPRARTHLEKLAGAICNSRAAKRVLELRWGLDGRRIRVCLNAVRPSCRPGQTSPRTIAPGQTLRLGAAGRLEPIKGFPIAIQTLAELLRRDVPATLVLAGAGPEHGALAALADRLGISHAVRFQGLVDDMSGFYQTLDLFLCPSLREPFGLVAAEALAQGVPVIATAVDGLPEVVCHGETGLCLAPTLDLAAYQRLGGSTRSLPSLVYDPASDRLVAPRALDPVATAKAIAYLAGEPGQYQAMSALGPRRVAERFDYERHVHDVLGRIGELSDRPGDTGRRPSSDQTAS